MTNEQFYREVHYQASIAPFRQLAVSGIITAGEFSVIDAMLTDKYRPVFCDRLE